MEKMKDLAAARGSKWKSHFASLTPEQKKAALEYEGDDTPARIEAILVIERRKANAVDLMLMAAELSHMEDAEPYGSLAMACSMARMEIQRLAFEFNNAALQLGLKASLAMEEGK